MRDLQPSIPDEILADLLAALARSSARTRREIGTALADGLTSMGWATVGSVLDEMALEIADGLGGGLLAAALAGAWRVGDGLPAGCCDPTGGTPSAIPPPALLDRLRAAVESLAPALRPLYLESLPRATALALGPAAKDPTASDADMATLSAVTPTASQLPLVEHAVAELRSRRLVRHEDLREMAVEARLDALKVAGLVRRDALGTLQEILAKQVESGPTLRGFAKDVRGELGDDVFLSPRHMETTFRDAVQAAYSGGMDRLLADPMVGEAFPYEETLKINDSRLSTLCAVCSESGIQGTAIFRRDDPTWHRIKNPRHYGCFLPWNIVEGRFTAGLKSWYSGEIVEITTRSGKRLTVTVHHPILTPSGFVGATHLREGDQLLCHTPEVDERANLHWSPVLTPRVGQTLRPGEDVCHAPAFIDDLFRSLVDFCSGVTRRTPTRPDDLHGDARSGNGYIEIADAESALLNCLDSGRPQRLHDFRFVGADMREAELSSPGAGHQLFERARSTTHRVPSPRTLAHDGGTVALHSRPFEGFRFGLASDIHASRYEVADDEVSRRTEALAQGVDRLPPFVAGHHFADVREGVSRPPQAVVDAFSGIPQSDASAPEDAAKPGRTDARFAAQLFERFPGIVSRDEIVEIRKRQWSGHVYDLQSWDGWIVAGGIFCSNCRCGRRQMTLRMAAREGIAEAKTWLRTGTPPATPAWVPMPAIALEAGL